MTLKEDVDAIKGLHTDTFLVADKATIDSYLSADEDGHILAIDVDFDGSADENRADETPGYEGWLRILGSLLWDDLGPLVLTQTQGLGELWPLSEPSSKRVYEHPLGPTTSGQS